MKRMIPQTCDTVDQSSFSGRKNKSNMLMLLKATFATGFTGQQVAKKGPYQRGFRHKTD
jgi:hypothetical protein